MRSSVYRCRVAVHDARQLDATRFRLLTAAFTLATLAFLAATAAAQNAITLENALPGNPPSEWDVVGAGDASIQGFATEISVDQGETVLFKVDTDATDYRLDIYRMGYYGGLGARKVATVQPSAALPQVQPAPLSDPSTGLVDCGNWAVSASWAVPDTAVSGVYIARLVREDPEDGRASHVLFVVRDDDGGSDLLFQTNDATWQAYNTYGGNSLYTGSPDGRAYKVSYNRPYTTRCCDFPGGAIITWFFAGQYPMVRWLEANGYDVSYFAGVDTDRRPQELLEHDVFLSVGHDEYWSGDQRAHVEAARDAGVHLAFFSGNEIFWKTRWESSTDGSATPYRTLVCYKETHANAKIDPLPTVWTGTWRDPRFSPPADGGRPENELLGTIFTVNGIRNDALTVPEADGKLRLWRDTSVASLAPGEVATFGDGTLGFEWDEDLDNGHRPPGLVRLSTTTVSGVPLLQDYGSTFASGTATHHVTMYRHAGGALVFSAGTAQWSWGLDATHDKPGPPADARLQQATVNLFADMGVQPSSLQAGLVAASASSDATAPVTLIAYPSSADSLATGSPVAIAGTAADVGGRVGAVEVSVDDGVTWHPATGRDTWSYAWVPDTVGTVTVRARAADDSGNLEVAGPGVTVAVVAGACPCNLFADEGLPAANDQSAVELGVRFHSDVAGIITGLRFYKPGVSTGGTHVGNLWTNTGTPLATATFANETDSGWQQVDLATAVPIDAGTLYVASVHFPEGNYAATGGYFAAGGVDHPPLHAPQDGDGGFANGVYAYGPGGFPTDTFNATNYWVDVVFDAAASVVDSIPPVITGLAANPDPSGTSATITWQTDEAADSWVDFGTQPETLDVTVGSATPVTDHVVTLTSLVPNTTYHVRVRSQDGSGNPATEPAPPSAPASFQTPLAACAADLTTEDFAQGATDGGTLVATLIDGEVILQPAAGAEFDGPALPAGWSGGAWAAGGSVALSGGAAALDGARVWTDAAFGPGRALEFVATFTGDAYQHAGLAADSTLADPWALFSTFTGGPLYARASDGTNVLIPGDWLNAPHRFRIDWAVGGFAFAIDGSPVANIPLAVGGSLRPFASDFDLGGNPLTLDWIRLTPFAGAGTFTSRVLDAGTTVRWGAALWSADLPAGTSVALSVRAGGTPIPDGTWTSFLPLATNGSTVDRSGRYLQYRADLTTTDPAVTPVLRDVTIQCGGVVSSTPEEDPVFARTLRVTPNPMRSHTEFRFALPIAGDAELTVYDLRGRKVRTVYAGWAPTTGAVAGWDGRDDGGRRVAQGMYLARLKFAGQTVTRRVMVIR